MAAAATMARQEGLAGEDEERGRRGGACVSLPTSSECCVSRQSGDAAFVGRRGKC